MYLSLFLFLRDDFSLGLFFYFIVCLIFYDFLVSFLNLYIFFLFFFVMAAKNGECVCRLLFLWQQFLLLPQRSFHVQFRLYILFGVVLWFLLYIFLKLENVWRHGKSEKRFIYEIFCCCCMDNKFSTSLAGCVHNKRNTEKRANLFFL